MTRAKRPERDLRNAILAFLRAHGIAAWPTGVGAFPAEYAGKRRFVRVGSKGMSDIVGIMPWCTMFMRRMGGKWCATVKGTDHASDHVGRFLAIEVKNPGGKVSPQQTAFLQTVVKAGGLGFVAHSVDEVKEKLRL